MQPPPHVLCNFVVRTSCARGSMQSCMHSIMHARGCVHACARTHSHKQRLTKVHALSRMHACIHTTHTHARTHAHTHIPPIHTHFWVCTLPPPPHAAPPLRTYQYAHAHGQVVCGSWCPAMDLLALVTNDNQLSIHRLDWQKLWTASLDSPVTAMCWRPDGWWRGGLARAACV